MVLIELTPYITVTLQDGRLIAPYRPGGLPLAWQDDQSSTLTEVVMQYYASGLGSAEPLTLEQFILLLAYCRYFIEAPCWKEESSDTPGALQQLREQIPTIQDVAELSTWLQACLDIYIDVL